MEMESAVVEFGTQAVLSYREICLAKQDDQIPELFFGRFIAPRLELRLACPVSFEHQYEILATRLGVQKTSELTREFGELRADILVDQTPPAVIEFKIFREGTNVQSILSDQSRIEKLARLCNIRGFLGIMICETTRIKLISRVQRIEELVCRKVHPGPAQLSVNGGWEWCFGCIALQD
jgi:hypothetical protein